MPKVRVTVELIESDGRDLEVAAIARDQGRLLGDVWLNDVHPRFTFEAVTRSLGLFVGDEASGCRSAVEWLQRSTNAKT